MIEGKNLRIPYRSVFGDNPAMKEVNPENLLPAQLSPMEARVLGCLIEKQATTPEQYPLTLNSLVLACNQKTSREPLMSLEQGEVGHCVRELESRGLLRRNFVSRTDRIEHSFEQFYSLTSTKQALLGLLLLRGPQTLNELFIRSERLAKFVDLEDVMHTLDRLINSTPALVVRIARAHGQREDRFMHRLCGEVSSEFSLSASRETSDLGSIASSANRTNSNSAQIELMQRVERLEAWMIQLQSEIDVLKSKSQL